ncbi:hypothetical protein HAX54_036864, partial [Datura stramonium]|nr:hypothetical protein [Datura stramonium]
RNNLPSPEKTTCEKGEKSKKKVEDEREKGVALAFGGAVKDGSRPERSSIGVCGAKVGGCSSAARVLPVVVRRRGDDVWSKQSSEKMMRERSGCEGCDALVREELKLC